MLSLLLGNVDDGGSEASDSDLHGNNGSGDNDGVGDDPVVLVDDSNEDDVVVTRVKVTSTGQIIFIYWNVDATSAFIYQDPRPYNTF